MPFEARVPKRVSTKACVALIGPGNSGKTIGALIMARGLGCKNTILIETQPGQSDYYANSFRFKVIDLVKPFSPDRCIGAVKAALDQGADCIIFDSLSHEWIGTGGVLQQVEETPGTNSYAKWKKPSRDHQEFVEYFTSLTKKVHFIACIRAKSKAVIDEVIDEHGQKKNVPRKIGEMPLQREDIDYEFPVALMLEHGVYTFRVWQDKCVPKIFLTDEKRIITDDLVKRFAKWLQGGGSYEDFGASAEVFVSEKPSRKALTIDKRSKKTD